MPRRARSIVGGYPYHVLNRANGRLRLFRKQADFAAFDALVAEAVERVPLRIVGYTIMSNHWHFVVWPKQRADGQVSEFFRWLTVTHSQRWHAHHGTAGMGHVYQGRFKSFPIAADEHFTDGAALHRAQSAAGRLSGASRRMAMGQFVSSSAWYAGRTSGAGRLARSVGPAMVRARQQAPKRDRTSSDPPKHRPGATLRWRGVAC